MRLVADSHAILWYVQGSPRLSDTARSKLADAEASDGIVVSVATLVDLWYVTQTTAGMSAEDLTRLTERMRAAPRVDLHPIDVAVVQAAISIPRPVLTDPWDRFIVATALALQVLPVTRSQGCRAHRALCPVGATTPVGATSSRSRACPPAPPLVHGTFGYQAQGVSQATAVCRLDRLVRHRRRAPGPRPGLRCRRVGG